MANPPNVLTAQYDQNRSGTNTNETCLSAATWSTSPTIQITYPTKPAGSMTNSPVYAQPLYVHSLPIGPGGSKVDVVVIATLDDYVYVYDADLHTPTLYYSVSLINDLGDCYGSGNGIPIPDAGEGLPRAGIVSTPVIYIPGGGATPTLTVVGGCQVSSTGSDSWNLHTLNLLTGQDFYGPGTGVPIKASVSSADGAAGCSGVGCNTLAFSPNNQLQRSALLQVTDGMTTELYIGFGVNLGSETNYSSNPYHGWLVGYNPGQTNASFKFATTPTGPNTNPTTPCTNGDVGTLANTNTCGLGAGIWMAGKGPVRYNDNGTRYVYVGSGNGGFQTGNTNWGSSVLGFSEALSGGPPISSFTPSSYTTLNGSDQDMGTSGPLLTSSATNFQCYANKTTQVGFPGGTLALSSNGTSQSTAILWAITLPLTAQAFVNYDAVKAGYLGTLSAYQLTTAPTSSTAGSFTKLWSSAETWTASKFAIPTIANGRVYVPTYDSGVLTYGTY